MSYILVHRVAGVLLPINLIKGEVMRMKRYISFFVLLLGLLFLLGATFTWYNVMSYDTSTSITTFTGSVSSKSPVYEHTSDTVLSSAQCTGGIHTNQGATGRIKLTLDTCSQGCMALFVQEEAQTIETAPPSGETIYLDGAALDSADHVIDSDGSTIGSSLVCLRRKNDSGTATWFCESDGNWSDGDAAD